MNKLFTKSTVLALVLLFSILKVSAQSNLAPTAANLFCEGASMVLPAAAPGNDWILRYSENQSATPTTTIIMADGKTVAPADMKTGYYYLSSKSTAAGSCESDMQEIPVYVLKPLVPTFTALDFCVESPLAQVGSVVNPDSKIPTLAYQWYVVTSSGETAISGATNLSYTPAAPISVGVTKYRLKVGYLINGNKYCAQWVDHDVTVTAKPSKPTITPSQISGTASAVTF